MKDLASLLSLSKSRTYKSPISYLASEKGKVVIIKSDTSDLYKEKILKQANEFVINSNRHYINITGSRVNFKDIN